jgi:hypothetical protein
LRYIQAIVILFVALGVLVGIQTAIATVDPTTIPTELQPIWGAIAYVFTTSKAVALFTILRNLLGYAYTWFETEDKSKISYEADQLMATWLRFELYLKGFTLGIVALTAGTPYEQYATYIAGSFGLLIDIFRSTITKLKS